MNILKYDKMKSVKGNSYEEFKKSLVSILLLISILFSLMSCDLVSDIVDRFTEDPPRYHAEYDESFPFPKGYTGGVNTNYQWHLDYEVKWLDTYDELKDAVTRLRAHGTEVAPTVVFDCEEYGLDLKFCVISPRYLSEELSEDQGYFDRYLVSVSISTYVFFEDASIDEIIFDWILYDQSYKYVMINNTYLRTFSISEDEEISIRTSADATLDAYGNGEYKFNFEQHHYTVTEEDVEILEKTLVVFE